MISAVAWVPKGVCKARPSVVQPSEEELEAIKQSMLAKGDDGDAGDEEDEDEDEGESEWEEEEEDASMAVEKAKAAANSLKSERKADSSNIEARMAKLDMSNYDNEDAEDVVSRVLGGGHAIQDDEDSEDDSEEAEALEIKPTDLIILAARNEDDVSNLEVWVYEEAEAMGEANVFVHHDILLPAFPLCVTWLSCSPDGSVEQANMAAVGTMEPGIEIWDLDVVDSVEPAATLGGEVPTPASEKKSKKSKSYKEGSHKDSVLGLSWNLQFRNVLASASADKTVKVWDISKQVCQHTLKFHKGKVQAVSWNPAESTVLLTGAFDKVAALVDVRAPTSEPAKWQVSADVEALTWHPHQPTCFLVSSEDGIVACFDARKGAASSPVFTLSAHDAPTCTMSFSSSAPGLLATGSTDKKVKLWDVSNNQPSLLASQDLQIGAVFSASFCGEAGHLLACGGAMGSVTVWDMRAQSACTEKWPQLLK